MKSYGCNRSFQHSWLAKYPWLVYSSELDGEFCCYCTLFAKNAHLLGVLVRTPFRQWVKVNKILKNHCTMKYHLDATEDAMQFKRFIEQPGVNVDVQLNEDKHRRIKENRHIVKCAAEAVLYYGRQCIALRGHSEKLHEGTNPGNFLALMNVLAAHDQLLEAHLDTPRMRNATYMSGETQNQLAETIGKDIIQQSLVQEVREATFFTIMVDEVTSHNNEVMPLCVRFIDRERNIREEFLQFSTLTRTTGEAFSKEICESLEALGLDIKNLRGQGYDGAANMASERVGVQSRIRGHAPLASYTHCTGHCLNLVTVHSCKILYIKNTLDKMQAVCAFFLNSPKRNGLLEEIVGRQTFEGNRRKSLIDLCKTRWAERQIAYQHFYQCFTFITTALEVIALSFHQDDLSDDYRNCSWDNDSKNTANSFLHAMTSFDFIVSFLITYQYLSPLAGITVSLQRRTADIVSAHESISETKEYYRDLRGYMETQFEKVFQQAVRLATSCGTQSWLCACFKAYFNQIQHSAWTHTQDIRACSGKTKVPDLDMIVNIQEYILRLEISMNHLLIEQRVNTEKQNRTITGT